MANASYSISEAAEFLNLSTKTIRRYVKSGKLPFIKVSTKFGEEYRITEIPEDLRPEAEVQGQSRVKVELTPVREPAANLDMQQLYQENIRLAAQLGAATEKIRHLEEQLKLLEAPKNTVRLPWWKRLFGV